MISIYSLFYSFPEGINQKRELILQNVKVSRLFLHNYVPCEEYTRLPLELFEICIESIKYQRETVSCRYLHDSWIMT